MIHVSNARQHSGWLATDYRCSIPRRYIALSIFRDVKVPKAVQDTENPGSAQKVPCQKISVIFLRNITINWATTTSGHALSYSSILTITEWPTSPCAQLQQRGQSVPHIEQWPLSQVREGPSLSLAVKTKHDSHRTDWPIDWPPQNSSFPKNLL